MWFKFQELCFRKLNLCCVVLKNYLNILIFKDFEIIYYIEE